MPEGSLSMTLVPYPKIAEIELLDRHTIIVLSGYISILCYQKANGIVARWTPSRVPGRRLAEEAQHVENMVTILYSDQGPMFQDWSFLVLALRSEGSKGLVTYSTAMRKIVPRLKSRRWLKSMQFPGIKRVDILKRTLDVCNLTKFVSDAHVCVEERIEATDVDSDTDVIVELHNLQIVILQGLRRGW